MTAREMWRRVRLWTRLLAMIWTHDFRCLGGGIYFQWPRSMRYIDALRELESFTRNYRGNKR